LKAATEELGICVEDSCMPTDAKTQHQDLTT
jgi:hypothetical protein